MQAPHHQNLPIFSRFFFPTKKEHLSTLPLVKLGPGGPGCRSLNETMQILDGFLKEKNIAFFGKGEGEASETFEESDETLWGLFCCSDVFFSKYAPKQGNNTL